MKLKRSHPLRFEREDGSAVVVPPISRGQMREAIALDPAGADEGVAKADTRRAAQLRVFLAKATFEGTTVPLSMETFLDSLDGWEEQDILAAIVAHHHGYDPVDAVSINNALREIALKKKSRGSEDRDRDGALDALDGQTLRLAAKLHVLPSAIDVMPYLDSVSLIEAMGEREHAERKWEAAVHGMELKE